MATPSLISTVRCRRYDLVESTLLILLLQMLMVFLRGGQLADKQSGPVSLGTCLRLRCNSLPH